MSNLDGVQVEFAGVSKVVVNDAGLRSLQVDGQKATDARLRGTRG